MNKFLIATCLLAMAANIHAAPSANSSGKDCLEKLVNGLKDFKIPESLNDWVKTLDQASISSIASGLNDNLRAECEPVGQKFDAVLKAVLEENEECNTALDSETISKHPVVGPIFKVREVCDTADIYEHQTESLKYI